MELKPLDPLFPIERQLGIDESPVVLINVFTVDSAEEAALVEAWTADAEYMKAQPGFVSTQLHRALGASPTYLNYAIWESTWRFRAAFSSPGFIAGLAKYPPSAVATPHLFRKVAIPGLCVA